MSRLLTEEEVDRTWRWLRSTMVEEEEDIQSLLAAQDAKSYWAGARDVVEWLDNNVITYDPCRACLRMAACEDRIGGEKYKDLRRFLGMEE